MSHSIEYESWVFPAQKIRDGNIHLATSLLSSSLEVNSFSATVECDDPSILNFRRNAKLMYYSEAGRGTVWRVQNIERIAPRLYKISATSTLGILGEGLHYGGIYTGQTVGEVIQDICGSVPVIVKSNLKDFKLYGWLPIAAPRDNLSQVLFAIGAALKSDLDGVLKIQNLWDNLVGAVGPERMYVESKVTYTAPITSVIVSEHHYFRGGEEKNLYSGDTLDGDIITFDEPMHSLTAEGFSIQASGANWAKLSAGSGTLRGKAYIHSVREVERAVSGGADPNVKRVESATLVSLVNSYAVADRLKSFYALRETIEAPIIYRGESTGDLLRFYHPFDEVNVMSCLQSADITLSNTLKAQTKSLINFLPEKIEDIGYYDAREVILEDQEWVVPEGVQSIRVILIGGGQGGASGTPGFGGTSNMSGGIGGEGGSPGVGGEGGHILQFAAEVNPGDRYSITIGKGGAGGMQNPSIDSFPGEFGESTTFGPWTSASGPTVDAGFTDPTTQEVFAARGRDGTPGGKGGDGGKSSMSESSYAGGGESVTDPDGTVYSGGNGGWGHHYPSRGTTAGGGGGSGAAVGNNGANGGEGTIEGYVNGQDILATGGNGGRGASAIDPPAVSMRGGGGNGGHGGGGGGAGGGAAGARSNTEGRGAFGGAGSSGSSGADGVAIIYYAMAQEKHSGQFRTRDGYSLLDRLNRRFIV